MTGRIAALNRFISRSTDKCLPFYKLLKNNKKFLWDEKCEEAFKQLKAYFSEPPILAKPVWENRYIFTSPYQPLQLVVCWYEKRKTSKDLSIIPARV